MMPYVPFWPILLLHLSMLVALALIGFYSECYGMKFGCVATAAFLAGRWFGWIEASNQGT